VQARPGIPETAYEIVGVVKDTKYENLRKDFVRSRSFHIAGTSSDPLGNS
jgi:hypothetical protein